MKLSIKLVRDISQSYGQFIAFVLVIAVGAFFHAGLVTYSDHLSAYTAKYFKEHRLSDLYVYYDRISTSDIAGLSETEGIAKIEGRYTFAATQAFEEGKASLTVHSIPARNEINTPAMIEGSLPSGKDEIILDSHYAKEHDIHIGDRIGIAAEGKEFTFTVTGLCENVEYAKKNDIQDHKAYGFAYVAEGAIPEIRGGLSYNEIMVAAKEGYDIDRVGASIEERSKQRGLSYVSQTSKERTFSYSKIQETIYNNALMSKVIPLVFFAIEAMILFLAMSRMVDSQRKQVGIMKALGVRRGAIILHYMGYPVLASVAGSVLGFVMAGLVFVPFVTASSARAYSLPGIDFTLSISSILLPILFSGAFGAVSSYFSCRGVSKEPVAQAMRPKSPKAIRKIWIENVPSLWRRIPYTYKLILRNLFLNKRKALASSIGVMGSTVLLITAFSTQTALLKVAEQIEEVYRYDLRIDYKVGTTADHVQIPPGAKSSYVVSTYPIELSKEGRNEKAALVVTEKDNRLIQFFDENEERISLEDNGVLVPKSYADKYRIQAGDTVEITFAAPELNRKTAAMKVVAISTQYSNPSLYGTPDYLESLGIDAAPTSLFVEANRASDIADIRDFYERDPQVDSISDKEDLKKTAQYIVKQNSFVFIMFIVCAVILSFGAIYTISSINIYERNRELATLKVLGYRKRNIMKLIFFENIILTAFAAIVAIPIGGYLFSIIVAALSSSHQQIPEQLNAIMTAASVILIFLLTIISSLLLWRKVTRINMIESLKSVD
ncbi:ABC transporter permease [Paenibacillus sp.]|uniref:ABC transporter permease n=1 Tax=Paenibacillus sp. TaxID=58172 RepID=UPI0028116527|nr:ABC transporter permease [Paenibacillus sp.]